MVDYKKVVFEENEYCVCKYNYKKEERLFVIDAENLPKILKVSKSWYKLSTYIGCNTDTYLHNVVMDKAVGGGKGQKYTVDHKNRITNDNRKANLHIISQSEQNENQAQRERKIEMPKGCGVKAEDIPKCVWFDQNKNRQRFVIELKKNGVSVIENKETGNKHISIKAKLERVKQCLIDLKDKEPDLMKNKNIVENYSVESITLMKEFNAIIKASKYDCAKKNLIDIPERKVLTVNQKGLTAIEKRYVSTGLVSEIPVGCGVDPSRVPKFCYYVPEKNGRGDAFVIDKRHPELKGLTGKQWKTTGSSKINTKEKFRDLLKAYKCLKNGTFSDVYIAGKKITGGSKTSKIKKTSSNKKKVDTTKSTKPVKKSSTKSIPAHKKKIGGGSKTSTSAQTKVNETKKTLPTKKNKHILSKESDHKSSEETVKTSNKKTTLKSNKTKPVLSEKSVKTSKKKTTVKSSKTKPVPSEESDASSSEEQVIQHKCKKLPIIDI